MAGLGDGLNDVSMLREVDLPVIVRSDLRRGHRADAPQGAHAPT